MKTLRTISFLWGALFLVVSGLMAQAPKPVRTQAGLVQGTLQDGVAVYRGIPFAATPVGNLRWRAPQPAVAWTGVRSADKFAPACMQVPIVNKDLGMESRRSDNQCDSR